MPIAITRAVSPSFEKCELTHLARERIDVAIARTQHADYENHLAALGCEVRRLPAEADLPDSVFVEDAAIVFDEIAVIARPGADSRKPETETVAAALERYRKLVHIRPPATLDGGDVLCVGRRVFVGLSERSNSPAVDQLRKILQPFGYAVDGVEVSGCLHLKSAVTQVGSSTLLANPSWIETERFADFDLIHVDENEPHAANALLTGGSVVYPSQYPATASRLVEAGIDVRPVDVTEVCKAEGGVTCCSLIFREAAV